MHLYNNKDENAHRFTLSGELLEVDEEREKDRERKRERERERERKKEREREKERKRERNIIEIDTYLLVK